MAPSLKHTFQSAKTDGGDNTQVQPSNWNAEHTFTLDANSVVGNSTDATAAVAALPLGTLGLAILAANSAADLIAAGVSVASTGDLKLTFKTAADTGWIMYNDQTIGPTGSTATYANDDCENLYTLLYTNIPDTYAPVTGGRGASASADWTAKKPLQLVAAVGRALAIAGSGSGLTDRALGLFIGEETHELTTAEAPTGLHTLVDPGHFHAQNGLSGGSSGGVANGGNFNAVIQPASENTTSVSTGITLTDNAGGGSHNNMQPTTFVNAMVCK